jgi:hypothetical protein
MDFLKAEQVGNAKWRVLAIPFGGPFKGGKDTDGEFFSPRTDIKADWFRSRPVIWHHGMDSSLKDTELGTEDDLVKTDEGWWATMWLDRSNRYWEEINKLLAAGKMFGSSGAIAHLVEKDHKTGEILRWPHAEQTLTPTPANFYSRIVASKAVDHLTPEGVRELLTDLDSSDDLRSDLPSGGNEAARLRLAGKALRLLERVNRL